MCSIIFISWKCPKKKKKKTVNLRKNAHTHTHARGVVVEPSLGGSRAIKNNN